CESWPSSTVSLSSSGSPALHLPSASVSVPSLAGLLVPLVQSSQVSVSVSRQMNLFRGCVSWPSATPSLSSSGSPALHSPSVSVSVPSFEGALVPLTQSSQVSASASRQINLFNGCVSWASTTPSLSSSVSPALHSPSASVSVPSFEGAAVPLVQSSQVSASRSRQMNLFNGCESWPSSTVSLSSSGSQASPRPSASVSVCVRFAVEGQLSCALQTRSRSVSWPGA